MIEGWLLLVRQRDRCLVMVVQVVVLGMLLLLLLVEGSFSVHQVFVESLADVVAHLGRKLIGKMLLRLLLLLLVVRSVERLLLVHELLLLALVVLAVVAEAAFVVIRWLEGHLVGILVSAMVCRKGWRHRRRWDQWRRVKLVVTVVVVRLVLLMDRVASVLRLMVVIDGIRGAVV